MDTVSDSDHGSPGRATTRPAMTVDGTALRPPLFFHILDGGLCSLHMTDPFGYDVQISGVANNALSDGA